MAIPLSYRIGGRHAADDQPVSADEAAGLRTLSRSALRLRGALRAPQHESALRDAVTVYVAAAAARGISFRRTRDALELLVHEHASRRQPAHDLLHLVLRLASETRPASAPQLREAL
jgi:hypothetical protein